MPTKTWTLASFVEDVEKRDPKSVIRIKREISPKYEIQAIVKEFEHKSPILIFEKVKGHSEFTVITNVFAERERFALALDTDVQNLHKEWMKREKNLIKPKMVNYAPVKEVVLTGNEVDLYRFPIITHFEQDAGPYITSGILVAKDPETGIRNASFHRLQLKGKDKLGVSLHSRRHLWIYQKKAEEKGEPLEVAVVIGAHPTFALGGIWKGPIDVDEYEVIGGFMGEPLPVTNCETIALEVPAYAEIVLEGEILPNTREPEGPFSEFTGYASTRSTQHVLKIKGILSRKNPLYQDISAGFTKEHLLLLAVPQEIGAYQAIKSAVPSVKAVSYPISGACRFHCYISIKKSAEGEAKNAIFAALGNDLSLKLVIVVDDDINVFNESEVLWACATRMQGDEDILIMPNCMGAILDPSNKDGITAKVGIDATKPLDWTAKKLTLPQEAIDKAKEILNLWEGGSC